MGSSPESCGGASTPISSIGSGSVSTDALGLFPFTALLEEYGVVVGGGWAVSEEVTHLFDLTEGEQQLDAN